VVEEVAGADGALLVAVHDSEASWSGAPVASRKVAPQPGSTAWCSPDWRRATTRCGCSTTATATGRWTPTSSASRASLGRLGKGAGRFGPPSWADARIELPAQGAQAVIRLTR
jgi:hypothetical protein